MVKAFEGTDYKLVIIGSSSDSYDDFIKQYLADRKNNITFLGKLDFPEIKKYLQSCLCTICPSECYDNMPNTVLESYGYRKTVIASRLGALIDLVPENETGLNFTAGDHLDLRSKMEYLFANKDEAIRMGEKAKDKLLVEYSENLHYERLIHLFKSVSNAVN